MSNTTRYSLFFVVIFFANIIQAITGFAGTTLAMPFSIILVGGEEARVILNILGIVSSIGVVILNRKSIVWYEVIKICLVMGVGMAIGFVIIHFVNAPKEIFYFILAGVILVFAAIGIYTTFFKKEKTLEEGEEPPVDKYAKLKEAGLIALLVAAGIVHGMFVCGGPLLIIYATKKLKERDEFRATLSMAWIVLNTINLVRDIVAGAFTQDNVTMYDSRLRLSNQIYDEIKKHFQELVFDTIIARNVKLSEAPSYGLPAILYDADSKGAKNYLALAQEILKKN